jgi:hypothetical protein
LRVVGCIDDQSNVVVHCLLLVVVERFCLYQSSINRCFWLLIILIINPTLMLVVVLMINQKLWFVVCWWLWLSVVGYTDHQSNVVACSFFVSIVG